MIESEPITAALIVATPVPLAIKDRPADRRNYSRMLRTETRFIVLHSTEGHEGCGKDTDVAEMFADPQLDKPRSAHYVVSTDGVTRCVPDGMMAWHSGHTGNHLGIGIELCGTAAQTPEQWFDALSLPMLQLAARLVADLCIAFSIPVMALSDRDLMLGMSGITSHNAVSKAWHESNHTDPGPSFPFNAFVSAVAMAVEGQQHGHQQDASAVDSKSSD